MLFFLHVTTKRHWQSSPRHRPCMLRPTAHQHHHHPAAEQTTRFKRRSRAYADRSRKLHCRIARIRSVRYPSGPLLADKHLGGFTSPSQALRIPLAV